MRACCEERVWDGDNENPQEGDLWSCPKCGEQYKWDGDEWVVYVEEWDG
jgi:hypothetical protein